MANLPNEQTKTTILILTNKLLLLILLDYLSTGISRLYLLAYSSYLLPYSRLFSRVPKSLIAVDSIGQRQTSAAVATQLQRPSKFPTRFPIQREVLPVRPGTSHWCRVPSKNQTIRFSRHFNSKRCRQRQEILDPNSLSLSFVAAQTRGLRRSLIAC